MKTFISETDEGLVTQATTFCANVDPIAGPCGLDSAKVTLVKIATLYYIWVFTVMNNAHAYSKAMTEYKDLIKGVKGGTVMVPVPVMGTNPTMPAVPTNPDLRKMLTDLVQDAKRSTNFTPDAARSVGVLEVVPPFNPEDGKPTFKTGYSSGGHPHLVWVKGLFQGVEIWKDSSDGKGYQKLDKDFKPDFTDKTDLPALGVSVVWKYKMIYIFNDEVVGSYSVEQSVTVTGEV